MTDLKSLLSNLISGNDQLAESTVNDIAALGESALPALFDLLDSPDLDHRWWAMRVLCLIPHRDVLHRLHHALNTSEPAIRQCAALGLAEQSHIDSIPYLISALDDVDRLVARLAGDALITIGEPAVTALIETLEEGSQSAQIDAARALATIADRRAIPVMFKAWDGGSTLVQYWVELGFEKMGVGMQFFKPE